MSKPIEAGCLAEVIDGLLQEKSPNLGLIVRVLKYVGDEKHFGRIWRCEAEYGTSVQTRAHVPAGQIDFAQSWLRRLPDEKLPDQTTKVADELAA